MKPLVLLDCDNVLADFTGLVLDKIHERTENRYTHRHVVMYDILACLPESKDVKRNAWDAVKSEGACRAIKPFLDAFEGVKQLREIADIHVVTTPLEGSVHWIHERKAWLNEHFSFGHQDITFTHRKDLIDGDFIIDDKPENVLRFGGLLWDQPYNRNVRHPRRVANWGQVLREVRKWAT